MAYEGKYDLEDRLVKFAILILEICDLLPNTKASNNLNISYQKAELLPL